MHRVTYILVLLGLAAACCFFINPLEADVYPQPLSGIGGDNYHQNTLGNDFIANALNYGAKGDLQIVEDATTTSGSFSFTVNCATVPCYNSGELIEYSSNATSSPIDTSTAASGTTTSPTAASVTTTANNDKFIVFYAFGGSSTGETLTGPTSGYTQRDSQTHTVGLDYGAYLQDKTIATAGATGTAAVTGSGTVNQWTAASVAVKAANTSTPLTFVGSNYAVNNGSTSTLNFTAPSGAAANDIQVVCTSSYAEYTNAPSGSGWALISATQIIQGGSLYQQCYQRILSGSGTGNVITTTGSHFTAGDVGKIACAAKCSSTVGPLGINEQMCGTIAGYTSGTSITTSFSCTNAATNTDFRWATNDFNAVFGSTGSAQAAIVANGGGEIYFPCGHGFGFNATATMPQLITVTLVGCATNLGSPPVPSGTLDWLTTGLSAGAISYNGASLSAVDDFNLDEISNLALYGGAGAAGDGGGSNGIDVIDWWWLHLRKVDLQNWANNAINQTQPLSGLWNGGLTIEHSNIQYNGNYGWYSHCTGYQGCSQNNAMLYTQDQTNGNDGVNVYFASATTLIGDTVRYDDLAGANQTSSHGDMVFQNDADCLVDGNWVQSSVGGINSILDESGNGCSLRDNLIDSGPTAVNASIYLSGMYGVEVTGNNITPATGPCIKLASDSNLTVKSNSCGSSFTGTNDAFHNSQSGTAGSAACEFVAGGMNLTETCFLNGYDETGAAQTVTFPMAFAGNPIVTSSCASTPSLAASTTTLTLPTNISAQSCEIVVQGQ